MTPQRRARIAAIQEFLTVSGSGAVEVGARVAGVDLRAALAKLREQHRVGRLPPDVVEAFEKIPGWEWEPRSDRTHRYIEVLEAFVRKHGWDSLRSNTCVDGLQLGVWVRSRRLLHRLGTRLDWVEKRLEAIPGWSWKPPCRMHPRARAKQRARIRKQFVENLHLLRQFLRHHPWSHLTSSTTWAGVTIGRWALRMRVRYNRNVLPAWMRQKLERVPGWTHTPNITGRTSVKQRDIRLLGQPGGGVVRQEQTVMVRLLQQYLRRHDLTELDRHTTYRQQPLGAWVRECSHRYARRQIDQDLVRLLEAIPGWAWSVTQDRDRRIAASLRRFVEQQGWDALSGDTVVDGVRLKQWAYLVRRSHRLGTLTAYKVRLVESIPGWSWQAHRRPRKSFRLRCNELRRLVEQDGWVAAQCARLDREVSVESWVHWMRKSRNRGALTPGEILALESIPGWSWFRCGNTRQKRGT